MNLMGLEVFYITNNCDVALIAERAGVDRIWIDLETLGKEKRQKGLDTVKSHHSIHDIERIAPLLKKAKMLVRINPWNKESPNEINQVIQAGAQIVMLPMWTTADEVRCFVEAINHRVKTCLLLETKEAVNCLEEVLAIRGIDEIHIGLNDLHLSYNLSFMFELLANGTVERIIHQIKRKGIPYGFGGISHIGDGLIPSEMIVAEHYRLGSTRAILSRGFCDQSLPLDVIERVFTHNMIELRVFEDNIKSINLVSNKEKLDRLIFEIAEGMRNEK